MLFELPTHIHVLKRLEMEAIGYCGIGITNEARNVSLADIVIDHSGEKLDSERHFALDYKPKLFARKWRYL